MENVKKDELRSIFKFLCTGKKNFECEDNHKFKTSDLVFGLDCYASNMNSKKKEELIEQLMKRGMNSEIDFDEFSDFFRLKSKNKHQKLDEEEKKKISRQMFFLIYQLLGIEDENKKLDRENVKNLFYIIFNLEEVPIENKRHRKAQGPNSDNNTVISVLTHEQRTKSNLLRKLQTVTPTPNGNNQVNNWNLGELRKDLDNKNEEFLTDLIKGIDFDEDGYINLKDFEFLLDNYFNDMEKSGR